MSAKHPASPDLQLRLELLCLRAALERQSLEVHRQQLREQLSPQHWLENASALRGNQLLVKGFSLAVQYPYLTSALTAMLVRRRWRALKWAGVALAVWQTIYIVKEGKS
jgi:hypothetical protein